MSGSSEQRLPLGFGLATLVVLILGWISYDSTKEWVSASAAEMRTREIETRLQAVLAHVTEAESAMRGYVVSGDDSFLPRITRVRTNLAPHMGTLRRLIADPAQRQRLARLELSVEARLAHIERSVANRKRGGFEAARQLIASGEGRLLQDRIRVLVREMSSEQHHLLAERARRSRKTVDFTRAAILSSVAVAVVLLWTAYALVRRELARRRSTELSLRDFNDQLRASEERHRQTTFQLERILRFSPDAICTLDAEGRFVQMSPASRQVWGYEPEEMIGRRYTDYLLAEDLALTETERSQVKDGKAAQDFQNRHRRKDGSVVQVMGSAQWSEEDGLMFCIARDVTEKERLREEAERRREELERTLAELAEARDRAVAADQVKSAFLAAMSHELRTPLNSIIGFTGILLQRLAGPVNDEQQRQLEMVRSSARHLLALINDILDISRLEAGELRVDCEEIDLRRSVERVAGIVAPLAERKNLPLVIDIAPDLATVRADQRRVEQILLNLLSNAIKFTLRGRIALQARRHEGLVEISVADTGPGIRPEDLETVFQPFRQVDSGLAREHEGTGLGLAISRRLAGLMGGEIRLESTWERGSTFTLVLPAAPNEREPSGWDEAAQQNAGGGDAQMTTHAVPSPETRS